MGEVLNYFAVSMKKIDGTENDYELVTSLNPCFQILSKEKLAEVENIVFKAVEDIKAVLKSR